jgi:hypothetical protein
VAIFQRTYQAPRGLLAFAADDGADIGLVAQDVAPVIGREDAAIDDQHARHGFHQGLRNF